MKTYYDIYPLFGKRWSILDTIDAIAQASNLKVNDIFRMMGCYDHADYNLKMIEKKILYEDRFNQHQWTVNALNDICKKCHLRLRIVLPAKGVYYGMR